MTSSIKIKFSLFLAILLLLVVVALSLLVLEGILQNQRTDAERYLAQQGDTANFFMIQSILSESNKSPQAFLSAKGKAFAEKVEQLTGQTVVLYDANGKVLNPGILPINQGSLAKALSYALQNKIAYLEKNDALYYMSPLRAGNEQVGVIQFNYSLSEDHAFYQQIKELFITIGALVFVLSFIAAYFYFNTFASRIIMLNKTVAAIKAGSFGVTSFRRRDEIGQLSRGIAAMSAQIQTTLQEKDAEQEKLALAVQKLSKLDRQQKQFIGNVTHEFKTPLTSIKAYLDLLDMYPDDEQLLETAKTSIAAEAQRLYEMVEKVLQLSATEKYEFEFSKEKVAVPRTIEEVLQSLKGKLEKFGLTLETNLTESYVLTDKDSMILVLINLLDNAIKYNKPQGHIAVSSYIRDGLVFIDIEDTGIGIPTEAADKIFDPFYTVDKNRSRQSGGAGLGLSLAKTYAEMQDGSLELVRSNASGSLFRVAFPALIEQETRTW